MPRARCGLRVRLQHAPVAAAWLRCRGRERLVQLHRADPGGTYLVCNAAHVPLADRSFDGILCLDVLEHVTNERAVLAETARLLKPGGTLVLTVPHSGLLAGLDSPNLFGRLVHATRRGRFPPEIAAAGCHHHYAVDDLAVDDLRALVSDAFTLVRVRRTGLGVAELVHLPALVLSCRRSCCFAGLYGSNHFTPGRRSRTIRCTFSKMSFRSARLDTTSCWSPGAPRRRA